MAQQTWGVQPPRDWLLDVGGLWDGMGPPKQGVSSIAQQPENHHVQPLVHDPVGALR
jgi:hypothetical protein